MCGICGQLKWGSSDAIDRGLLERMNRSMTHRGPDDEGYFTENTGKHAVGLAMRRLSIIDLSTGHQPIENETGDVTIVYNGETYNFQELRSELTAKGHTFKTKTDTEAIVHGYEEWGPEVAARLNGMFAFAIWDKKRARLVLARDHMGIKPLYYALGDGVLSFGSEIKAILQDPSVSREIDPLAVDDYLSMRFIPTPRSIYKSIRKLEPGHVLVWENGTIKISKFWNFHPAPPRDEGLSYYLEKLDALLDDAVKRQMIEVIAGATNVTAVFCADAASGQENSSRLSTFVPAKAASAAKL
jgi:asparagine synthase (glutamine-hydrolysing)